MPVTTLLAFALGAAPGVVAFIWAYHRWAQERLQRSRADRRAARAMVARDAALRRQAGLLAWGHDLTTALRERETDVARLAAELFDANRLIEREQRQVEGLLSANHRLRAAGDNPGRLLAAMRTSTARAVVSRVERDPLMRESRERAAA